MIPAYAMESEVFGSACERFESLVCLLMSEISGRMDLGFCPVGKQKSKLLIILKGCQGDRKSSCAYVSAVAGETFKTTLGIGISKDLSVRTRSGPASLR